LSDLAPTPTSSPVKSTTRKRWRNDEATIRLMIEAVRGGPLGIGRLSLIGFA
jgi:hypothetical protein